MTASILHNLVEIKFNIITTSQNYVHANPQHSNIRLFDYIIGNGDRHGYNLLYDKNHPDPKKRVIGIDNGGAFSKYKINTLGGLRNINTPFDPEFIEGVKNADEAHLRDLFERVRKHPDSMQKDAYGRTNGFLMGNDHNDYYGIDTPRDVFLERLKKVQSLFNHGITDPQKVYQYLKNDIEPGGARDNTHLNTHNNTYNNTYNNPYNNPRNNTFNNTHNNKYNNTYGNPHNNTWNNTHNNPHNNTFDNTPNNADNAFIRNTEDFNREAPNLKVPKLFRKLPWANQPEFTDIDYEAKERELEERRMREGEAEQKRREKQLRENKKNLLQNLIEELRRNKGSGNGDSLRKLLDEARTPKPPV